MKKLFLAVALLLGMSALFVSCNKDNGGSEGDYAKLIVGTWEQTKVEYYYQGKLVETAPGEGIGVFTADGKYYLTEMPNLKANYSISGNKLTVDALISATVTILKLTKDELQLEDTTINSLISEFGGGEKIDKGITYFRKVR